MIDKSSSDPKLRKQDSCHSSYTARSLPTYLPQTHQLYVQDNSRMHSRQAQKQWARHKPRTLARILDCLHLQMSADLSSYRTLNAMLTG